MCSRSPRGSALSRQERKAKLGSKTVSQLGSSGLLRTAGLSSSSLGGGSAGERCARPGQLGHTPGAPELLGVLHLTIAAIRVLELMRAPERPQEALPEASCPWRNAGGLGWPGWPRLAGHPDIGTHRAWSWAGCRRGKLPWE